MERSSPKDVPRQSGSRLISSCRRIFGSYGRETSSRIMGDCSRFKAAVVCVFGIVEIFDEVLHVPMPLMIGWTMPKLAMLPVDRERKSSLVELLAAGE